MPKPLTERGRLLEATSTSDTGAVRRRIQIITPGWGSSGYYSPEVLQEAATNRVIPAGTHMYLNHASESERTDRPERDVRDIAAVLVEDAAWTGSALEGDADLLGANGELVEAIGPYIGVSISGSATDITIGEAEGRTGPIIEGLAHVASVDFVTHAGRGGRILLESARPSLVNAAAVRNGVDEATVNDTRDALQTLLRDAHGADKTYVWVRDFDDTTVWFEVEAPDDSGLFAQAYTGAGTTTALTGDRTEVRVITTYVPVNPAGQSTTTEESQEDTMPQIEEARLRELEEAHGRVPTLESERDTAVRERDTAQAERDRAIAERDRERRRNRATDIVREHRHTFTALEARGLVVDLPLTEAGDLDEDAFRGQLDEHAAADEAGRGAGSVSGFGSTTQPSSTSQVTESKPTASPWGRPLTEKEA